MRNLRSQTLLSTVCVACLGAIALAQSDPFVDSLPTKRERELAIRILTLGGFPGRGGPERYQLLPEPAPPGGKTPKKTAAKTSGKVPAKSAEPTPPMPDPHVGLVTCSSVFVVREGMVAAIADLPELEAIHISGVFRPQPQPLPERTLRPLAKSRKLRNLRWSAPAVLDADLKAIAELSQLRGLFLLVNRPGGEGASATGLRELAAGIPNLEALEVVPFQKSSGEVPAAAAAFAKLRYLRLVGPLDDTGLERLASLTDLKVLSLTDNNLPSEVTGTGLSCLKRMLRLTQLELLDCDLTDGALTHIAAAKNVESLTIGGSSNLAKADFKRVVGLPRLKRLELRGIPLGDDAIPQFAKIKTLEALVLEKSSVTNAAVKFLQPLKALKELSLRGTAVDDDAVKDLIGLRALEQIDLRDTPVTVFGIVELEKESSRRAEKGGKRITLVR